MRRRRTAYVDICPVCSDEKSTSDLDCPYCGYPMGKDWETVEIDLDTRVIIKTIIAAHRGGVMTNETQERKPLWSDGEIHARYTQAFGNPPDVHHFALLTWLRDEYEAQLAALAELRHEVGQVRQPPAQDADVREALAEYAHEAWSGWMKYMFGKGLTRQINIGGGISTYWLMPAESFHRWQRQMKTPYADLPEEEKASDRKEADEILTIVQPPAPTYEPVPDGDYGLIGIQHDGERLCLYIDEPCRLPEGWRLMRPRAGEARN